MKLLATLALLASVAVAMPSRSEDVRRDGNWWLTLPRSDKLSYTLGVFDGAQLGSNFSMWKYMYSKLEHERVCTAQAQKAYSDYFDKYFANTTNGQLVDGLDTFYEDYRNRRIRAYGGIWLVMHGIAGLPEKELDKMTESWRSNSSN